MEITLTPEYLEGQKKLIQDLLDSRTSEHLEKLSLNTLEQSYLADLHESGLFYKVLNYMKFNMVSKSLHNLTVEESARRSGYLCALEEIARICKQSYNSKKIVKRDKEGKE